LSEFYTLRRSTIKDTTGLIFFVVGWVGSAPIAWPYIRDGFDSGDPTTGVMRFALIVFGAAIACGLLGMLLGALGGWTWEHLHRRWRVTHPPLEDPPPRPWESEARAHEAAASLPPLPPIAYDVHPVTSKAYLELQQRFTREPLDRKRTTHALRVSLNISAWDGERLVGIARILTDGYYTAALAEITVDPDYQRRGMGRELMNRAFAATPRGTLFVAAPLGAAGFFDHIGCDRGLTGFTMRREARRNGA
jgi:GNAT superfamily N-acetyltransferase